MNIRKEQAEQTKQNLMTTAFKIIKEEGFAKLSANRIAKEAGISKGGLFHHFPQMEDLYLYMLDILISQFEEDLDPSNFENFSEYMNFSTEYMFGFLEEAPEVMTAVFYFISQSSHNEKYMAKVKTMFENSFRSWGENVGYFFKVEFTQEKKDMLVRLIDLYFAGFSIHYLLFKDKDLYRKISEDFTAMVINTIEGEVKCEK